MVNDPEFEELAFNSLTKNNMTNWHSWRTIAMWALMFVVGGLQALQGNKTGDFTSIIAILGFAEHLVAGNSDSNVQ